MTGQHQSRYSDHALMASGLPHSAETFGDFARFQAKCTPVRVKKTRQIKNLEPRFDSIEAGKALANTIPNHTSAVLT
jgi:hypothetical protein